MGNVIEFKRKVKNASNESLWDHCESCDISKLIPIIDIFSTHKCSKCDQEFIIRGDPQFSREFKNGHTRTEELEFVDDCQEEIKKPSLIINLITLD